MTSDEEANPARPIPFLTLKDGTKRMARQHRPVARLIPWRFGRPRRHGP
jgi:hypothetical protein